MTFRSTRRLSVEHTFVAEPRLRRTYFGLSFPGGCAADLRAQVPVGTGHIVEHLLSRQSDWRGGYMDRLGCEFALMTNPEVMHVFLAVPSSAKTDEPLTKVLEWWDSLKASAEELEAEVEVVIDELLPANRQVRKRLWRKLMTSLAPLSHVADHVGGRPEIVRGIQLSDIKAYHSSVSGLACSVFGVGPNLSSEAISVRSSPWKPRISPPAETSVSLPTSVDDDSMYILCGARRMSGYAHGDLGALVCFSALRFSKLHPTQRAFIDMGLKLLRFEVVTYASASFLTATTRVPGTMLRAACEHLKRVLEEPVLPLDAARARRACIHRLEEKIDDPRHYVRENATRALAGGDDLVTALSKVQQLDERELLALAEATQGVAIALGRVPAVVPG